MPYTFETLLQNNFQILNYPSLRYITQAGGKLEKSLVKQFLKTLKLSNIKFYIMYGQTEAAPRISYLPPDLVEKYPGTIGKAIPGGNLFLLDNDKNKITQPDTAGELSYSGPNVMMGYATKPEDLSTNEKPDYLLTGDIACFNKDGMFYITGRTKRFVKPFGIRINLDDIQTTVKLQFPQSAVTGNDNQIIIALLQSENSSQVEKWVQDISESYKLPRSSFNVQYYEALPLLPSGKYDYKSILNNLENKDANLSILKKLMNLILEVFEINTKEYPNILTLYQSSLNKNILSPEDSFRTLEMDSLSYVSLSLALHKAFNDNPPENWPDMTIFELNELYLNNNANIAA